MIESINHNFLIKMYTKGFFPMAKNMHDKEINFYKPNKRLVIPISNFHVPKKLYKEFLIYSYNHQ